MCLKKILKSIGILTGVLLLLFICFYYYLTSMTTLPKGEFINAYPSPRGFYSIHIYVNSPALSRDCARGVLVDNITKKSKNIYWAPLGDEVTVQWLDEENVIIDDVVKLNVLRDHYDFRKDSQ